VCRMRRCGVGEGLRPPLQWDCAVPAHASEDGYRLRYVSGLPSGGGADSGGIMALLLCRDQVELARRFFVKERALLLITAAPVLLEGNRTRHTDHHQGSLHTILLASFAASATRCPVVSSAFVVLPSQLPTTFGPFRSPLVVMVRV